MSHARTAHRPAFLRRPATSPRPRVVVDAASEDVDWEAAGWAGFAAGAAFIVLQTVLTAWVGGGTPADDLRRIAAIALGEEVLPGSLTAFVIMAAAGVHLMLSMLYARVLAVLVHGLGVARCAVIGALFGMALYAVNYYAFSIVFPWFAAARGGIALFSHAMFGLLAAAFYERQRSSRA